MSTATVEHPKIVSQEEWLAARQELLAKEKRLTRERDALAAERRKLPWVRVEKNYLFESPNGKKTLAELFDGRSQLIIYHFMFGPDWEAGCPSCSIVGDHIGGSVTHLANRDVTLVAVSRAPLPQIAAFQNRMGWRFKWYSSFGGDFNRDFNVSFTKEEVASQKMYYNYKVQFFPREEGPGASVFYKAANGNVFHTYSAYGRGLEPVMGVYNWLDLAPKGRDEQDQKPHPMAWVRHHDRYESNDLSDKTESTKSAAVAHNCCASHS
jgi:predicted dithiol-disulfide oxidoreductase (DUF899 family)